MQFQAFDPEIEVNGQTILSVVKGMLTGGWLGEKMLRDEGIDEPKPGEWYGQQAWLNAFRNISEKVGALTLRKIGNSIPETADWPPQINDVHGALASIDVAYHLNHRKQGTILFDLETGAMSEGIGHYTYATAGDAEGRMVCENPYPCEFDLGIIQAAANKFKPEGAAVVVEHEAGSCRKDGAEACAYHVSW
jgi:hypothetical protein